MGRKQYIADLQQAINFHGIDHIHDVQKSEDDGQFTFLFSHSPFNKPIHVTAGVNDLSDYPNSHDYFIFAGDDTPAAAASTISKDLPNTSRKTVTQLLSTVATALSRQATQGNGDVAMPDSQASEDEYDMQTEDEDEDDDYDDEADPFGSFNDQISSGANRLQAAGYSETTPVIRNRIRADLRAAKEAGFKVGYLRGLLEGHSCFVSISVRIAKLGISESAMQAWQVEASDYLILLIQYPSYRTMEQLLGSATPASHPNMRVRASKRYKPSLDQALEAFAVFDRKTSTLEDNTVPQGNTGFRPTFISKSLQNLLNERFINILKYRDIGMSRSGAEQFYGDNLGARSIRSDTIEDHYFKPETPNETYPEIVSADHWAEKKSCQASFPLLAMQMLLKHFVRCTEFCVVCHRKIDSDIEAIKPYVCENGLCLFQYVTMGFGPSFEHEIIAQPYTVDLLISFAYAQAAGGRLKDFPHGLGMIVPESFVKTITIETRGCGVIERPLPKVTGNSGLGENRFSAKFDHRRHEVLFTVMENKCPVRVGDWIVVNQEGDSPNRGPLHCRVTAVCHPSITVDSYVITHEVRNLSTPDNPAKGSNVAPPNIDPLIPTNWQPASVEKYTVNFDELNDDEKRGVLVKLLQLLPSVPEMKNYVSSQRSPDLAKWSSRIPPAVLSALRWIIASNRACIMQVYDMDPKTGSPVAKEDRVYGMKDWMQFRFAMGAPDKEKRFLKEVRETAARLNLQHPTLFAFHGSALQNWHSIIREGLNYDEVRNGRAYGNGVYHSLELNTSLGYSGGYSNGISYGSSTRDWPNSVLTITTALALNEIVNAPAEFTNRSPHLVVQHVDWIQTRYLFVKCAGESVTNLDEEKPKDVRVQDSAMTPRNSSNHYLIIPACPSKTSKRRVSSNKSPGPKSKKHRGAERTTDPMTTDDDDDTCYIQDYMSDATDAEDLEVLFDEGTTPDSELVDNTKPCSPKTDFVPRTLDHTHLRKLPMPKYANITATMRLQKDFVALLKVQKSTPLHELGWYIDPAAFDCPYQWIVELHSFHIFENKGKKLPIVQDMKKAGLKSVILEMRFPGSYPMSPPFVRVLKPRFLSLMQGGGGHVTAGGALCMELLTNSGWSAVSSIESVLLQVRLAMASTEPSPARLASASQEYGVSEAIEAYKRACNIHGWEIPADFDQMADNGL